MKALIFTIVSCCSAGLLFGDFSYQQQTKITGGAMMGAVRMAGVFSKQLREPMATEHYYKGNRMAIVGAQSIEIIDLDKETITTVNVQRKTYTVMTFEEMKQAMDDMARKMHDKQGESQDVTFDASVQETGQHKTIGDHDTHEAIVKVVMHMKDEKSGQTSDMTIRSDMWLAPDVAGYDEVRAFQKKMAEKLGISLSGGGMGAMMRPEMLKGMSQAAAEASKLTGVPVYDIVSIEGAPGSDGAPPPSASSADSDSQPTSMTQALGRLGGFGRHKKNDNANQSQDKPATNTNPNALMEMTTESSNFTSGAVDDSKFEIPVGYKQVEAKH